MFGTTAKDATFVISKSLTLHKQLKMKKFSISARLTSRPNSDGTRSVQVVYIFNRVAKEYATGVAVHPSLWNAANKLCFVHSPADVEANNKIQRVQALLHSIASNLPEPDHELVKAAFKKQAFTLELAETITQATATITSITSNESLDDVFGTLNVQSDLLALGRAEFRELMNEGDAMVVKHQQQQQTQKKSTILKRLEKAGIYKTPEKVSQQSQQDSIYCKLPLKVGQSKVKVGGNFPTPFTLLSHEKESI